MAAEVNHRVSREAAARQCGIVMTRPILALNVFVADVFLRSCHTIVPRCRKSMGCGHATLDSRDSPPVARLCYSWPLSPGNAYLCLFVPNPVPHRICFVPLYRPGRRINPAPSPRHNLALPGFLIASNIESRLDLPCTRPDPHAPARVQPSTPPGLVFVGRARSGNQSQCFHPRLGEGEWGAEGRHQRQQQQPHRDTINKHIDQSFTDYCLGPSCP
jgi:hypothetical protein